MRPGTARALAAILALGGAFGALAVPRLLVGGTETPRRVAISAPDPRPTPVIRVPGVIPSPVLPSVAFRSDPQPVRTLPAQREATAAVGSGPIAKATPATPKPVARPSRPRVPAPQPTPAPAPAPTPVPEPAAAVHARVLASVAPAADEPVRKRGKGHAKRKSKRPEHTKPAAAARPSASPPPETRAEPEAEHEESAETDGGVEGPKEHGRPDKEKEQDKGKHKGQDRKN